MRRSASDRPVDRARRWSWPWLMGGVILLAFILRVYHLDYQSLWRDEVDALRFALLPPIELLATFTRKGWNGPLYFPLLRLWIVATGQTEFALRFSSLLGGMLAVPLTYALGRSLGSHRLATLSSLMVCISPYLVWYSQEVKMYALLTSGVILSWYLYLHALRSRGWRLWAGYVLVTTLCIYLHLLAVLLIPAQAVVFLLQWSRYATSRRSWLIAMAALILPYLPFALWEVPLLFSSFQTGHPFYPLHEMLVILVQALNLGIAPRPTLRLTLPLQSSATLIIYGGLIVPLFLSLAGLFLYQTRMSLRIVLCWVLLPPVTMYLVSLGMPIFSVRYLIWIAPGFLLLLGMGLVAVRKQSGLFFLLCTAGLLFFSVQSLYVQSHMLIKSDFRHAAAHVRAHRQSGEPILFLIPYIRHTFEYYYGLADPWVESPYANGGLSPEEVSESVSAALGGAQSVWLVLSEPELWDERGLVREWLESHGRRTDEEAFARVIVARYVLADWRPQVASEEREADRCAVSMEPRVLIPQC